MSEADLSRYEIWFDGACEPVNPGGVASCGWIVYEIHGGRKERLASGSMVVKKGGPESTNNYAEWCGLGCGLRWLLDNARDECSGAVLTAVGDSQLVLKQLAGQWKCRKPHLKRLKDRCELIIDQLGFAAVNARWVPRKQNAEADRLSKRHRDIGIS